MLFFRRGDVMRLKSEGVLLSKDEFIHLLGLEDCDCCDCPPPEHFGAVAVEDQPPTPEQGTPVAEVPASRRREWRKQGYTVRNGVRTYMALYRAGDLEGLNREEQKQLVIDTIAAGAEPGSLPQAGEWDWEAFQAFVQMIMEYVMLIIQIWVKV
jgi:hypothetical protein